MSHSVFRVLNVLGATVVVSFSSVLGGCTKPDRYDGAMVPSPASQAQAIQTSIAAAASRQQHEHHSADLAHDEMGAPANVPMGAAMPSGTSPSMSGTPSTAAPAAMPAPEVPQNQTPTSEDPSMKMGPLAGGGPPSMSRMLGQGPMPSDPTRAGGLPTAMGSPHIYHVGAETFFLPLASSLALTPEQQQKLTAIREAAAVAFRTGQRRIDQSEQDLWVLTASEAPDISKIQAKAADIASLSAQQRVAFIRAVGEAVGVLSDAQRKAVTAKGPGQAVPSSASGAAPSPTGMNVAPVPPAPPPMPGMGGM